MITAASPGRLFVLSAPSGAGKTTLTRALLAADPELRFSVSFTTRPPRANETDGRDYYFVDRPRFEAMITAGTLLEHAEVFGNYYGTGREQIEHHTREGRNVLLDIDWQGARQVRRAMPESVLVFILPPSLAELERRLRGRATDSEEVIRRRLSEAMDDMQHWREFDHVVVNEHADHALAALRAIIAGQGEPSRSTRPQLQQQITAILASATPSG
jgi:guanylate kinase